jgi:hypothetical protein
VPQKPKDPKKHHYVPCVLLSRFGEGTGRDALIYVWDKQTGKVRWSGPRNEYRLRC